MIKIETKVLFQERVMVMALAQATKSHEPTYTINDAMDVLLSSEGLIFYGNVVLPFVDRFPKDTELYRVMTTKPEEVSEA